MQFKVGEKKHILFFTLECVSYCCRDLGDVSALVSLYLEIQTKM